MKLTNLEVLNIVRGVNASKDLVEASFPIKFAWGFHKNVKKISELAEMIEQKLNQLEQKYADDIHSENVTQTNENGEETTMRVVKQEYSNEFQKEKSEFFALENDVDIQKFSINDLGNINVSITTINALEFMLDDIE